MDREQFTFYRSFLDGVSRIRKKADRCDAYDAIVRYALYEEEPELDSLSDAAALAYIMAKPNIDAGRKKAQAGRKGGESKPKSEVKLTGSKPEAKRKQGSPKQEKEQEQEQDKEQMLRERVKREKAEAFDRFWQAYPKKVGKGDALKAFEKVMTRKGGTGTSSASPSPTVEDLIAAVERQKQSDQWTRDGGRYIPNPSTWLNQGRWEDELRAGGDPQVQHHGEAMSPAMRAAVAKMMEGEDDGTVSQQVPQPKDLRV